MFSAISAGVISRIRVSWISATIKVYRQKLKKTDVAFVSSQLESLLWTREEPVILYSCEQGAQDLRLSNVDVGVAQNRMYCSPRTLEWSRLPKVQRSIDAGSLACLARGTTNNEHLCQ
jgi:hypothetical protein